MRKYILLLFIFFSYESQLILAQNSQLRSFSIENGLPQSQVYDIIQDQMGYLWLGTQGGGICSFDGNNFKVWNESNGLISNYINALYSKNDSLFVGTDMGLSIKSKNKFLSFKSPKINRFFLAEDKLLLATQEGMYTYSIGEKLQKLHINAEIDQNVVNDFVFDGVSFWIATDKGLWKTEDIFDSKGFKKIENENFTALAYDQQQVFAATFIHGISIFDTNDISEPFLLRTPQRINSMTIHQNNELWIATDNNGITIIDSKTYVKKRHINKESGLYVSHIRKTFADKQSNIWIATSGGGIYKYFQNNFQHFDDESGLKGNRVYAVHKAKNELWISCSEAGLTKIDDLGIHHLDSIKGFSNVKIKTITSDPQGNVWAGSDGKGILLRITKELDSIAIDRSDSLPIVTKRVPKIVTQNLLFNEETGFPSNWILKLVPQQNSIWIATYSSGIIKANFDPLNYDLKINSVFGKNYGIDDLLLTDIALDHENRLWYATRNGHLGYIKDEKHFFLGAVLEDNTAIRTLLFHQNKLYIGTAGKGIWHADLQQDKLVFKPLQGAKKLHSKNSYQLIFDDQEYLWVGTERGVDKVQLNPNNEIEDIYHFGRNDGFLGIETCLNAIDKDEKGNIWFGALYGLTKYTPSMDSKTAIKPMISFEDIQVTYKSLDSIHLKTWTNSKKVLQLDPTQNQLSFAYRTVDIDHPNQVEYRSKLNHKEWSPWSKENKQNFAELQYGSYQFAVQSRNYRWQESDPIRFSFFIDTPLYKKAWFQWMLMGLAFLLLFVIGWSYIRKIRAKSKADKAQLELQNHLLSLEHRALQLQMNPHFIFNVLNGVKAMANSKPEKMNATINSFAVLLRETLNNSRKEHITLEQEMKTLHHYITLEQLMASKPFTFDITSDCDFSTDEILVPPMLIQPFVENAVRHGILKGNREGILKIEFTTIAEELCCKVIDNGIGIFNSQENKTKTDHQSMALTVTKERLASIAGSNTLDISEIKNDDGTIGGTTISFKIPILIDY